MVGMIQILTGMLAFYLVIKGIEVLQIGLASNRPNRKPLIIIGVLTLAACIMGGCTFVALQDSQANSVSTPTTTPNL